MPDFQKLIRERLRGARLSPVREAEIVDELAQHLSDRYEALRAAGSSEAEASRLVVAELDQRDLARELQRIEQNWSEPVALGTRNTGGFWSALRHRLRD